MVWARGPPSPAPLCAAHILAPPGRQAGAHLVLQLDQAPLVQVVHGVPCRIRGDGGAAWVAGQHVPPPRLAKPARRTPRQGSGNGGHRAALLAEAKGQCLTQPTQPRHGPYTKRTTTGGARGT